MPEIGLITQAGVCCALVGHLSFPFSVPFSDENMPCFYWLNSDFVSGGESLLLGPLLSRLGNRSERACSAKSTSLVKQS
ncbi:hypothetical protein Hanom_Chr09g00783501 [Helianthus anomalus]